MASKRRGKNQHGRRFTRPEAATRMPQELLPHVKVRRDCQWSTRPTLVESAVSCQRVGTRRKRYAIPALKQLALIYRQCKIDGPRGETRVRLNLESGRMGKIRISQQFDHFLHVVREVEIVIRQIAYDPASRVLQRPMAIDFTMSWPLGTIEKTDPLIG